MKTSLATAVVIVALSLAVWVIFYVMTPGTPLTPPETLIVVGCCGAIVLFVKWMWSGHSGTRGSDESRP